MENNEEQNEKQFTFVFSKADTEIILTGLGELPSKYSRVLMNKMEMVMVAQSIKPKENDTP
jgi:hypothetical protein